VILLLDTSTVPVPCGARVMLEFTAFVPALIVTALEEVTNLPYVVLPTVIADAAPNKLPVRALVLNTEAVPVEVVAIDGDAPFKFNTVALVPVIVPLPIVSVPDEAPILTAVAAPKALTVVAVVLNTASVELSVTTLVVNVGLVPKTTNPEPVSSERDVASCEEVIEPVAVPYNVPEVGRVTEVVPVVVRVVLNAPLVVRLPARSMLPASLIVLAALTISRVNVRPAVKVAEDAAAIVTSYAADVSRIPRLVIAVCVPPLIVGEVKVLLVNVSVVARPTKVSVAAGRVNVFDPAVAVARTVIVPDVEPLNTAPVAPIVGKVRVLLVRV